MFTQSEKFSLCLLLCKDLRTQLCPLAAELSPTENANRIDFNKLLPAKSASTIKYTDVYFIF